MRATGLLALAALTLTLAAEAGGEKGKGKGKLDPAKLVGTWSYVSGEKDGQKIDPKMLNKGVVEITKKTIALKSPEGEFVIAYKLDTTKQPTRVEMEITKGPQGEGVKTNGIIALKGEQLYLCYAAMGGEAPTAFAAKEGSGLHLFVLKRKK